MFISRVLKILMALLIVVFLMGSLPVTLAQDDVTPTADATLEFIASMIEETPSATVEIESVPPDQADLVVVENSFTSEEFALIALLALTLLCSILAMAYVALNNNKSYPPEMMTLVKVGFATFAKAVGDKAATTPNPYDDILVNMLSSLMGVDEDDALNISLPDGVPVEMAMEEINKLLNGLNKKFTPAG